MYSHRVDRFETMGVIDERMQGRRWLIQAIGIVSGLREPAAADIDGYSLRLADPDFSGGEIDDPIG